MLSIAPAGHTRQVPRCAAGAHAPAIPHKSMDVPIRRFVGTNYFADVNRRESDGK